MNGIDVPYFSAPANGNVVDETLDVDLSFLANSAYTLFVVERRWADPVSMQWPAEYFLGTSVPPGNEANPACTSLQHDGTLSFGYINAPSGLLIAMDQGCDGFGNLVLATPTPPPGPVSQETAVFGSLGHGLWRDGASIWIDQSTVPLSRASDGAIGRAVLKTLASGFDQRFQGDIAEIRAYDTALGDAERAAVEGYLRGHWKY
jgi:hypothetical protein